MKRISSIVAALVGASALGSAASQPAGTNPNDFAIGTGAGTIGNSVPAMGVGADTLGIGGGTIGVPDFGALGIGGMSGLGASSAGCPFSLAILCTPLPGAGIGSGLPPVPGSGSAGELVRGSVSGGLVPGVINVPLPPDDFAIGSSLSGLGGGSVIGGSPVGGSTIGGSAIGGANPSTGLTGVINSSPFNSLGSTPGSSLSGSTPPIGASAGSSAAPLPPPAAGGAGPASSPSGVSEFDRAFCTADTFGCL